MQNSWQKSQSYILSGMVGLKEKTLLERRLSRPFVTISRQVGAYGRTFCDLLSSYLVKHEKRAGCPWTVFDKNLVQKVVAENQYPPEVLPLLAETPVSDLDDMVQEIFGARPSQWSVVHRMGKTILQLAQGGYVILMGRGANIITRRLSGGIHIRLVGSYEKRLKHVREYYRFSEKEARAFLHKEQKARHAFIKKYFYEDVNNPSLYDFIINTDRVPMEEAAEMIGRFVLKGWCASIDKDGEEV